MQTKAGEKLEIDKLTKQTILEDDIFCEVMDEKDPVFRKRMIMELTDRAFDLGVKTKFEDLMKAYEKIERQELSLAKKKKPEQETLSNFTCFESDKYPNLFCGNWIADERGIRTYSMFGECLACYHPILPVERLTNLETGTEKIVLAFYKGDRWREITVDKEQIATNTKITALSNLGVSVTSENSRYLVKFLSDVENYNIDIIPERVSTSRMGWVSSLTRVQPSMARLSWRKPRVYSRSPT